MATTPNAPQLASAAEVVLGLVYAAGTDIEPVIAELKDYIRLFGYEPSEVRISDYIREHLTPELGNVPEADRIEALIREAMRFVRGQDARTSLHSRRLPRLRI